MAKKILAFVGMPGSGKGTAVAHFTEMGLPEVYFGGMVYEEVERRGLDRVKDEMFVRQDMRDKEGPAVMAKRAAKKAAELFDTGTNTVIFDGLYSWDEYQFLREHFGDTLVVIAMVADRKVRHERILTRQDGRTYTLEEIIAREVNEIETMNKGGPIAIADYYLDNNVSMEELQKQLNALSARLNVA